MAKKVKSMIKLQVPAAKATPAPPIGPALGQHGVNIPGFCKEFNERTQKDAGMIIPVVITVYTDPGTASQDRGDQEARRERHGYRVHHEHGQGYRALHGHHR